MELCEIYNEVNSILECVSFDKLFPGFRKYGFAVYNNDEICLNGELMPYDEHFRGNTSIFYKGQRIAIWHCDGREELDLQILAYCIVHEMFHAFQQENNETRFPDDLKMLNAPSDYTFYGMKYAENFALAKAYSDGDKSALRKFFEIRNSRIFQFPKAANEELKAETVEGVAEYIGLLALKSVNVEKFLVQTENHKSKLLDKSLLFDARRLSYYSGTIFCLTLNKFGYDICNDFSGRSLYEQNLIYSQRTADEMNFGWVKRAFAENQARAKAKIQSFLAGAEFVECEAEVCGYDPMNMLRLGDLVLCNHFILLQTERGTRLYDTPVVLKLKAESDREISGLYISDSGKKR